MAADAPSQAPLRADLIITGPKRFHGNGIPFNETLVRVDASVAEEIIKRWCHQLGDELLPYLHEGREGFIVLRLAGRNYTIEGAARIASFFRTEFFGAMVQGIEVGGLVGGNPGAEALQALQGLANQLSVLCQNVIAVNLINVCDRSIPAFPALMKMTSLRHLYVLDFNCSDSGMRTLRKALTKPIARDSNYRPCEHLNTINLCSNQSGDDDCARTMGKILERSKSLVSFQYSKCNAMEGGSEALCEAFGTLLLGTDTRFVRNTLQKVDFEGCHFNQTSDLLLGLLRKLNHLEYVNLCGCRLSASQGAKIFSKLAGPGVAVLLNRDTSVPDDPRDFDVSQAV